MMEFANQDSAIEFNSDTLDIRSEALPSLPFGQRDYLLCGVQPFEERLCRDLEKERLLVGEYLRRLEEESLGRDVLPEGYFETVKHVAALLGPMRDSCRVSVQVPVHREEGVIGRFLESYLEQSALQEGDWEVLILINGPQGYEQDGTQSVVDSFRRGYEAKDIPLRVCSIEVPGDRANVGFARRVLSDATLLRSCERLHQEGALYLKNEDADTFHHHPELLTVGAAFLDDRPSLDAAIHSIDWDPFVLARHDGMLLERRINYLSEREFFRLNPQFRTGNIPFGGDFPDPERWFRPLTSGWNTFLSAESLALLGGGFDPIERSEDLRYGEKLSILRGEVSADGVSICTDSIGSVPIGSVSDMRRHARNFFLALEHDSFVWNPYLDFADNDSLRAIRELSMSEIFRGDKVFEFESLSDAPAETKKLVEMLLDFYSDFFSFITPETNEEVSKSYAKFLGERLAGDPDLIQVSPDLKLSIREVDPVLQYLEAERCRQGIEAAKLPVHWLSR